MGRVLFAVAIIIPTALLNVVVLTCDGRQMSRDYLAQIDVMVGVFGVALVMSALGVSL